MSVCLVLALGPATAQGGGGQFQPGAAGAGDPYFPLDGNGGYDVRHYDLDVKYDPATDVLRGKATIRAKATQNLSRFNLDLVGLTVHAIKVDGRRATWARDGQELTITPKDGIRKNRKFTVVVRYSGIPEPIEGAGFIHTDDGALVVGEPHVAATWYPVNDHPSDKASYSFEVTVPAGLEAVANGVLEGTRTKHGWTTWSWEAKEPMASYLTTASMGEFELHAYQENAIDFFVDQAQAKDVVVHELAHQWYGDSLTVAQWQHIWLNEGFATYAEWLWNEGTRGVPAQEIFDFYYSEIPPDDQFWQVVIGDPGPDLLFDFAVYARGAMTLHQLRLAVGDDDFFKILKRWAQKREGDNVTTGEFIALAERISGEQLDELFETWLFTPGKPELPATAAAARAANALSLLEVGPTAGRDLRLKELRH